MVNYHLDKSSYGITYYLCLCSTSNNRIITFNIFLFKVSGSVFSHLSRILFYFLIKYRLNAPLSITYRLMGGYSGCVTEVRWLSHR